MSTIVKNEEELNTLIAEDLITENYALEILGLKNVADFRKFSRSFMKLSKIVFKNENRVASSTDLGNIKIGKTLSISEDGVVEINPLLITAQEMVALVEKYKAKE